MGCAAATTMSMTRDVFDRIESSDDTYADAIGDGPIQGNGNREAAPRLWAYLDRDHFADQIVRR